MSRNLLLVAFHFPPVQGSTGVLRTLAFCRYLKEHNWNVTVLTASEMAYPDIDPENNRLIPAHTTFKRAFALDTQRHLSIRGRYPRFLALPDRWQSWIPCAIASGFHLAKSIKADAVMSTYPLASAHCIGLGLHKLTGIPWIADFRDPMAQTNYPADPVTRRCFQGVERAVFRNASWVVTATGGAARLYADRYPDFPASRIQDIPNGFDEDMFTSLAQTELAVTQDPNRRLALLHSGLLYPNERNPEPFFQALAMLRQLGRLDPGRVEFVFLGSGYDELYQPTVDCLGISDFVTFKPSVPYKNALEEMCASDACLLFQGANCNQQIPAKVYEYLYAGKPIFALTDERGDTAQLLESVGVQDIVQMDNANAIADVLPRYLERLASNAVFSPGRQAVGRLSRRSGVAVLARILNQVAT